ncbi:response regulator transcription factor [Lacrimispora defluvii]|uniref:Stage 0 sporulation protein A homolog n=1 Tax=Lacrimispora defluvii TaxID=2719233 RepID=A0ABX1VX68_9FIRM|nr:response regulator transcription factor [Lacrimispora defluvii]MDD3206808.1 response regulator transcription factor [Lachnospiraceae bacterium]NNJ31806.1 response regulator transcription factor [Lacrimispora defluvii]
MDKKQILVVDDEQGIRDIINEYLVLEDFEVIEAIDGVDGLNKFKNHLISVVILDVMLPKMDGWKVCREIRATSSVPIIMLTARGEEYDKLFGFELGIDDYMVKPFSPKELLARIKAILGRSNKVVEEPEKLNRLQIEEVLIDFDARSVYLGKKLLSMTPKEYDLFSFFVNNQGKVFSREQLLNQVWGYEFLGDVRTVDTHIKMLRETLGKYRKWITTAWGIGYKFQVEEKV